MPITTIQGVIWGLYRDIYGFGLRIFKRFKVSFGGYLQ